jgi:hypothetical protein
MAVDKVREKSNLKGIVENVMTTCPTAGDKIIPYCQGKATINILLVYSYITITNLKGR